MIIKDQFDPELRKNIKKQTQIAIIPVGSIEQHGPHLPISTDSEIITEIGLRVSKKSNSLLIPTISYGVSFEHFPFFNLSLKNSTLISVLKDICISLSENHINRIIILNGHHGNLKSLKNFVKNIEKARKGLKISIFSYWHYMKEEFDHAGFVETSLMLAISSNVKMKKARKGLIIDNLPKKEIHRLSKLASKSFPKATKNGIWGDPTNASAVKGRKILKEVVNNIIKESNLPY
jgi:creatinine amidohydrolase